MNTALNIHNVVHHLADRCGGTPELGKYSGLDKLSKSGQNMFNIIERLHTNAGHNWGLEDAGFLELILPSLCRVRGISPKDITQDAFIEAMGFAKKQGMIASDWVSQIMIHDGYGTDAFHMIENAPKAGNGAGWMFRIGLAGLSATAGLWGTAETFKNVQGDMNAETGERDAPCLSGALFSGAVAIVGLASAKYVLHGHTHLGKVTEAHKARYLEEGIEASKGFVSRVEKEVTNAVGAVAESAR